MKNNKLIPFTIVAAILLLTANLSAIAQNNEPAKAPPPAGMLSLVDLLEQRAGSMGLVPVSAANDPDFIAFMTAIRSRDRSTGRPRPVAQAFEAESETSGLNSYELYTKMKAILTSIRSTSQLLYGVAFKMSQGMGQKSTELTTNLQLAVGRGLRVGFGLGWEQRGRWNLPIFTFRLGHIYNDVSGEVVIGVTADVGIESRQSGETPEMITITESKMTGGTLALGWNGMTCSRGSEVTRYNGVSVGAGYHCSTDYKGFKVKIPLFLPLPGFSPLRKALKLESEIIQALHRFDMTRASKLSADYKVQVGKAAVMANSQGLGSNEVLLEAGHPLLSPGNLFSGSALVAYSPTLAPDLVALYRGQMKAGKACEKAVIDIDATPVAPKQLPH